MPGKAYLVGAGPGSPDLITVRGYRLLQAADAVVHDRLADPRLLDAAPARARVVNVGKRPGGQGWNQAAINQLLIDLVRANQIVVRLKGGDPCIFGRGGEEIQALLDAGCAVEVVPGVSSVTGVPAANGLSLTQRGAASHLAVITGHSADNGPLDDAGWRAAAQMDTLVILMGMASAKAIQAKLLAAGKAPDVPVLVLSQGTWPQQAVARTDLARLAETIDAARLPSPGLIVMGEVVRAWRPEAGWTAAGERAAEPWPTPGSDAFHCAPAEATGLYPLTLTRLQERTAVVVGGGPVGERKCRQLLAAGARVILRSPDLTRQLQAWAEQDVIQWRQGRYCSQDLDEAYLAFAATNDHQVNREIAADAATRQILCNVATDADSGAFRVPAVTRAGTCLVAVSSLQGDPKAAQRLRDQIRDWQRTSVVADAD